VWLIGFFRQRNFGFILLGFVVLAEAVTALVRQALIITLFIISPIFPSPRGQRSSELSVWCFLAFTFSIG
jgi:hypothetical protein